MKVQVLSVQSASAILEQLPEAVLDENVRFLDSLYVKGDRLQAEGIQDIWQMEIEPDLEEYFFDNPVKMDDFIPDKIKHKLSRR